MRIDTKYFPRLRRGHTSLDMRTVRIKGKEVRVCSAEGCKGGKSHAFETRSDAANEWAEERGLKLSS